MSKEGEPTPGGGPSDNPGGNDDDKSTKDNNVEALEAKNAELLSEKKAERERRLAAEKELEEFRKAEKEAQRKKLEEEGRFKEALELKEKELEEERSKYSNLNKELEDGRKLRAFLQAVGGEVDAKFWGLIDLNSITVDDAGQINQDSVNSAAQKFVETYGNEVLKRNKGGDLPPHAPPPGGTNNGPLSHEEWLKLPIKERRERLKDVVENDKN